MSITQGASILTFFQMLEAFSAILASNNPASSAVNVSSREDPFLTYSSFLHLLQYHRIVEQSVWGNAPAIAGICA